MVNFVTTYCLRRKLNITHWKINFNMTKNIVIMLILFQEISSACENVQVRPFTQNILVNKNGRFNIWIEDLKQNFQQKLWINVSGRNSHSLTIHQYVTVNANVSTTVNFVAHKPGNLLIGFQKESEKTSDTRGINDTFVHVFVIKSEKIEILSEIIGWVYCTAWVISCYPQVYTNFRRRSVIGLNLDYVTCDFLGFFVYTIFNIGLFWIDPLKKEYTEQHPQQINPVEINDVFVSLHCFIFTAIVGLQCIFYEKGGQKISLPCKIFLFFSLTRIFVLFILTCCIDSGNFTWLDFVTSVSSLKLVITFFKYVPQLVMNYQRKSTLGFNVFACILDLIGGLGSLFQALLLAFNSDDWFSVFEDPVKFGLALLTIFFDLIFVSQRYFFYRLSEVIFISDSQLDDQDTKKLSEDFEIE